MMKPLQRFAWGRLRHWLLAALLVSVLSPSLCAAKGWKFATSERGISVFLQQEPGRQVPKFRGVVTIDQPVMQLLAVLADIPRSCEWNAACVHARVVKRSSDFKMLFHLRLKAPWPVSDRDAVLKTSARVRADGKRVKAIFRAIPYGKIKPASGVVRFPRLIGTYVMNAIGPNRTQVKYTIDSESGGWLPNWLVRYATQKVPIATLDGLRKQAKKTKGTYAAFIARNTPKSAKPAPVAKP
ncbi:MAG: hypothetical protein CMH53_07155 [Myxococcales bacterium]|nr:hypothetical protein [Myxococcales bacterium]